MKAALSRHAYAALAPFALGRRSRHRLADRLHITLDDGRHPLLNLPFDLIAFALVVPMWAIFITRGVLYPVFAADHLDQSWGGPTLGGAWFAHFIQGPPLLYLVTLVLRLLDRLSGRGRAPVALGGRTG